MRFVVLGLAFVAAVSFIIGMRVERATAVPLAVEPECQDIGAGQPRACACPKGYGQPLFIADGKTGTYRIVMCRRKP